MDGSDRGLHGSHTLAATQCIPEADAIDPRDPGGKSEGEGYSSNEMKKRLIAKIAAAVKQSDDFLSDKEGWPASFDDHSAGAFCENMDDDEIAGCHKAISCRPTDRR